jgi:hypothetical protein
MFLAHLRDAIITRDSLVFAFLISLCGFHRIAPSVTSTSVNYGAATRSVVDHELSRIVTLLEENFPRTRIPADLASAGLGLNRDAE